MALLKIANCVKNFIFYLLLPSQEDRYFYRVSIICYRLHLSIAGYIISAWLHSHTKECTSIFTCAVRASTLHSMHPKPWRACGKKYLNYLVYILWRFNENCLLDMTFFLDSLSFVSPLLVAFPATPHNTNFSYSQLFIASTWEVIFKTILKVSWICGRPGCFDE